MNVGRSHISATVNTLFLAYVGASLPLIVLFAAGRQDPLLTASMEVVAVEIVRAVVGSIGIVLAVPLTTAVAAALVDRSLPFRARPGRGRAPCARLGQALKRLGFRGKGSAMTAVIKTERLTKAYGEHRGIIELDLEVAEGEIFGFLGPNGAGKTTTMRVLLDLIRPTAGRAEVFGIETTADPVAIHRRVGYLPGEFDLYDRLTGAQTIEYFGNLRGGIDRDYVARLIDMLDLDPSRRFREYSKGNKQKVGLVVALQHKPDLLILDEPTSGLDPLVQQTFFGLVREAQRGGPDGLPLVAHHRRGRSDLRPGGDHPRGPPRPGRLDRGDPAARLPPCRADVRAAGRARRLRGPAGRERRRGRGPRRHDARQRPDRGGRPGRRRARDRRRRQPRTEPRGRLPRPVRGAPDRRRRPPMATDARVLARPSPIARIVGPRFDLRQDGPRQPPGGDPRRRRRGALRDRDRGAVRDARISRRSSSARRSSPA